VNRLERHRHFLDFALASLARRPWKNTFLLLCYALVIFVVASVVFFATDLRREAVRLLDGAPEMVGQRMMAGRQELVPLSYAEAIGGIRGVGQVLPRL
jgi:predicted lysophospholipase L1 biosynthesis ABC-type transport system permease subunit